MQKSLLAIRDRLRLDRSSLAMPIAARILADLSMLVEPAEAPSISPGEVFVRSSGETRLAARAGSLRAVELLLEELAGGSRAVEPASHAIVGRWLLGLFPPNDLDDTEKSFADEEQTASFEPEPTWSTDSDTERAAVPRSPKKKTALLAEEDDTLLRADPKPPPVNRENEFGAYRLERAVGYGGMAEVFRASREGRTCVIKKLDTSLEDDPELVEMFVEEARIARRLLHPNIVACLDTGTVGGVPFIAFELVDGSDLAETLSARGALPAGEAIAIVRSVARALEYAHQLRDENGEPLSLVHRDVSPENILISRTGEVKLLDFGLAKFEGRRFRTRAGVLKGKLGYFAPEQLEEKPAGPRSDLYQLGVVLAEALSGRKLFTQLERPKGQVEMRALLERHLAPHAVPPPLFELNVHLCAIDPEQRPASAREVLDALAAIERPARNRGLGMAAIALALLGAAVLMRLGCGA